MYQVIHNIIGFLGMQATFIKRNRIIRYSGMTASFVLFVFAILTAFPIVIKDDETRAAAPKASDTVLAMTTGSENAAVDITVSSASGTFASSDSTKTAKFGVTTNNYTGYTLTIAGTDDTGLLTNTDTSITTNNTLSSISSATTADTFSSSTALNGKWGYQPSKYNSTTNTSFLPAPTTTASILDATGTANPVTPNNYTIGVGARVDYNKPAGDYASTFILAAVGNPVGYSITYSDGTGDASVANLPTTQSGVSASTSAILNPSSTPTRTGYTFKSWCLGTVSDNGTTCTGTEYVSGDTIDFIDQTAGTNTADLYAVWTINTYDLAITFAGTGVSSVQVRTEAGSSGTLMGTVSTSGDSVSELAFDTTYYLYPVFSDGYGLDSWENTGSYGTLSSTSDTNPTFSMGAGNGGVTITGKASMINVGNMQGLDPSSCTANAAFATDIRDDQDYIIQRLEDGNCWMLDNLRLSDSSIALTSRNSNVPYTTSNPWYLPESSSSGFSSYDTKMINTDHVNDITTNYGIGSGKIGTYYNYCAATAGTYCYAPGATTSNAQYDVCPKGWRLPTGGSDGEYLALFAAYSYNSADFMSAFSATLAADFNYNNTPGHNLGTYAYFSTSTYFNVAFQYALYMTPTEVYRQNYGARNSGISVRCILDTTPYEKLQAGDLSMQDMGNLSADDKTTLLSRMGDGTSYDSPDIRDDQIYTVAKINDRVWMTRNLAIGCDGEGSTYGSLVSSKSLTSSDSNVSSSWSTPTAGLDNGNTYETPYMTCSSTYGAWYNYVATTAGTITGDSNEDESQYDICPKGWRLPTYDELFGLVNTPGSATPFKPVTGGHYRNTRIGDVKTGTWWSSTPYWAPYSGTQRYNLNSNGISLGTYGLERYYGSYVRCILDNTPYEKLQAGDLSMQDISDLSADDKETLLSSMGNNYYNVSDERDGQTYVVQKLDDDNLWMMTNLNLNATKVNLTSDNTNCATSVGSTDCVATGLNNTTLDISTFNAWNKTSGTATRTAAELIPLTAENTSDGSDTDSYNGLPYGTLYNYCAVTAGTICTNSNSGNASYDICPKGWRLPTSGSNGEFLNLYNQSAYHTLSDMKKSYIEGGAAFAYTGNFYSSTPTSQGATGYYWSSTRYDSSRMLTLHLRNNGTQVNTTDYVDRGGGYSVRCILNTAI